jgi:hypothetical protein
MSVGYLGQIASRRITAAETTGTVQEPRGKGKCSIESQYQKTGEDSRLSSVIIICSYEFCVFFCNKSYHHCIIVNNLSVLVAIF